jgi:hypothetical protein
VQQRFDSRAANRLLTVDQYAQRLVHARLALVGRQVQDFQVLPFCPRRLGLVEQIVGDAKATGGKQFFAVAIVCQRSRLAY